MKYVVTQTVRIGRAKTFRPDMKVEDDFGVCYRSNCVFLISVRGTRLPAVGQYNLTKESGYVFSIKEDGRRSVVVNYAVDRP